MLDHSGSAFRAVIPVSTAAPAPTFTAPANPPFDSPTATSALLTPGKDQSFFTHPSVKA
ncbi:hypothetical protein ALP33_102759 [Pseudomonas amygdali pv. lachrymans]|uniref:Uncharacterized protein n=1 Tax=Pseudomonas amygdali pv. lachrymans TaxID=53707 RepID=A0AB37R057_PSEAV|nr:Unknown protein sequence [Pseudomonas amygdali pv. lachrymans]KPC16583.1 Unknown protein sequence [Pseudomonas amygdali pv. lachrymans]RMM35213.1 hypothetical protein ALQ79_102756 [Pseudomonas amygdali pv. lachrymans]RMP32701.1 hypothetical protein ALQ26_103188 [Pseudomonas amygdali pv. lachrymans]RMT18288.1 hypothetical protein ALP54_102680 [Pseudomonas amygdali pv. lachrymans]